jgi:thiamine-phosphate pyrophosphorylase
MEQLSAAVAAGVDWVQVRERRWQGAALLELVDTVARTARASAARVGRDVRILVNRRVDAALAAGADGVHLGFDGMDPAAARALLGEAALVGVSCHAPEEVADAEGAGYAHLAPVFPPLSKAPSRPPLGVAALRAAAAGRPVLAQGGITAANAAACLEAGAAGVAVTGAVFQAEDAGAATRALRAALDAGPRPGAATS